MMKRSEAHNCYIDYLRSEGKNITPERMEILDEILKQTGHFQIDDIIDKMANSSHKISRATVYRSIKTIADAGLIKYIRSIHDEKIYEVIEEHHDHMICEKCGKIIEFHDTELEALQNSICKAEGFTPQKHTMKIFGICEECNKQ